MTVMQVCAYAAPYEGNFIKSLKALSEKLKEKKIKTVFVFPESAENLDWVNNLSLNYKVYFLPLSKARINPETYKQLKKIYSEHKDLEIIHSHFELYDIPCSCTAPKNVKVFWHLHDALENYNSIKDKLIHKIQYGFMNKKSILLSVSQKHKEYVLNLGFPKEKAKFIPNGIDIDRIDNVRSEIINRKYDFLIFGWEFERKGVDLCIEAVKKLNKKLTIGVVGNEDTEKIIKEKYGKLSFIQIIEPVKNINSLYSDSKCFLHISRGEGLSYALLESVYSGLPVICSDIWENKFAEKFPTVIMTENENITSIAEAMNKIIDNNFEIKGYEISKNLIEEKYSVSSWVNNIIKEYGLLND